MSRSYRRPYAAITGVQSAAGTSSRPRAACAGVSTSGCTFNTRRVGSLNLSLAAWSANTMTYGAGTAMVSSACRFLMRATGRTIFWK
jgi:hypothetical protein